MIPISVHPFFWILAALLGYLLGGTIVGMFLWIGIIFLSVLIHEMGHALTAVLFKQTARIQLMAMGGLTTYEGPRLSYGKQFLIVLNGPIFGFLLSAAGWGVEQVVHMPIALYVAHGFFWINLFWSVLNLFPILPMDGGQLLRICLEAIWGVKGMRAALLIGMGLSGFLSLGCFALQQLLAGALFFLFAYQNFEMWKQGRRATRGDRDDEMRQLLIHGEELLQQGNKSEAQQAFEKVLLKTGHGLLGSAAAQYLALLEAAAGHKERAYELLKQFPDDLAPEPKLLLHTLAEEHGEDRLIAHLAADVYQTSPTAAVALRNARAFARLRRGEQAGGWLETASSFGPVDATAAPFDLLASDRAFQEFVHRIHN